MQQRIARIDGVEGDGRFSMVLASQGEVSDGHILNIAGARVPKQMPLLVSHFNDPSATLGSVTHATKHTDETPPVLRAQGNIEMTGEGVPGDVRRDIAHMIEKGHLGCVSVRWDDDPDHPPVRRVNLPSDHPHFVDGEKEKDYRKRWGMYYERWRAMEGSVVAIGADPEALIGRAQATDGNTRAFWTLMADDAIGPAAPGPGTLELLRDLARSAEGEGFCQSDLFNAVHLGNEDADAFEPVTLSSTTFFLPARIAQELTTEREPVAEPGEGQSLGAIPVEVPPAPIPFDVILDVVEPLKDGLREARAAGTDELRTQLRAAHGRVS